MGKAAGAAWRCFTAREKAAYKGRYTFDEFDRKKLQKAEPKDKYIGIMSLV